MDAYHILVVIISVLVILQLVVLVVAGVWMVKLLKDLKEITEKAKHVATNVESVSDFFQKTAGPMAIVKLLANITGAVTHKRRRSKG